MPFDKKKFAKAKYGDRTDVVPVPDLAEYFDKGEKPEFVVRGLTGAEVFVTWEAAAKNENLRDMMEKLASKLAADKSDAILDSLGLSGKTPVELARRVEQLKLGSISPELDDVLAAKFFENHPAEAISVTTKITALTGKGRMPGESKPSGSKSTSETP
jgi:hypothetical protein